ncbi:MAG: hypothetical protein J3K34DRAFT_432097 [Monoraphidium minutum]|nr:MAG: hypothetical protein J3K34DRAFT_432097 [Monoraphidium minutum]
MILYNKDWWGLLLILRAYGSAFPRVLPPVLVSGALTAALAWGGTHESIAALWVHPYAYSIFAAILSFILVFRAQYGYNRWWEGATQLQVLSARLTGAASEILAFDRHTLPPGDADAAVASSAFSALVVHLCSLLHATCCQGLRRDPDLRNLKPHSTKEPPMDPKQLLHSPSASFLPTAGSIVGRARLKDMFVLRGSAPALAQFNSASKLPVIGGISHAEWTALACPASDGGQETLAWPSTSGGRSKRFARTVNTSCCSLHLAYMDRPHLVAAWLQEVLVKRHAEGGLAVPTPVLARAYQLLSDAMSGYEQCRKIAATPFPFPWAQFMIVVLLVFTLSFPLLVVGFIRSNLLAVFMSSITVGTYWATSEVAREIEDPFWGEPNSMPLASMQHQVNRTLLTLASVSRPASNVEPIVPFALPQRTASNASGATPFAANPFATPSSPSAASAARRKASDSLAIAAAAARSAAGAGASTGARSSPAASPRWGAAPAARGSTGLGSLQLALAIGSPNHSPRANHSGGSTPAHQA